MTFFYLTNFSYVKTVLTIWSVSQFAIFKNRHVFADPITYIPGTLNHKESRLQFKEEGVVKNTGNSQTVLCVRGGRSRCINHTHFKKLTFILRPKSLGEYPCIHVIS